MHTDSKNVLLISMPFAGTAIPSIQLAVLEGYLKEREINIKTHHPYLKAAEIYGLNNYNFLIYPPNDSYTAQMVFSKYVFPEHWQKTEDRFREYFNENLSKNKEIQKQFTFENYVQQTDKFYNWVLENTDWRSHDIIGFTLNYGQLMPSLAIAKKIKEVCPDKKIIFGGSRTTGTLGIKVLEAFNYVDFVVSGDGEDALYRLASDYQNYESIPRLMYRKGNEVIWNESDAIADINSLPVPSYDSFYEELKSASMEVQQYFFYNGRLPVEISRGCWWNQCSFCNLNIQHKKYREKNVDKIIEEIQTLSDRYKILDFQIVGNTLPKTECRALFEKLKQLGRDFTFFSEARAGQLKSEDYTLMKEAGFTTIQTGIESFSQHYLKKMNKGTRVIDNIAALKFCKENRIKNSYNLIVDYPNEEPVDFEETKKNIKLFKQHLDPPQICYLRVLFGSPIHRNPEQFNIQQLEYAPIDRLMYPQEFLEKGFNFVYGFKRKEELGEHGWVQLVDEWKKERELLEIEGIRKQTTIDKFIFYFVDGRNFVKIYDKRNSENIRIYVLDELEREIFLTCIDVISYHELKERFPDIPDHQLAEILETFEQSGIVFHEDDCYLSLPLRCNTRLVHQPVKEEFLLVSD
ncbi:MAG: RiPP maturation radical SAM C-methyltransferase [Euryarchaeota archaeon]|nr:RiPP maturation radical SAM C-methyltransferase [Euryarchaeota archaeon]